MPAADLAADEWTALGAAAVPFLAAIALFLISPLLTKKVKVTARNHIAKEGRSLNLLEDKDPPHMTDRDVEDYIEYAMDAVQIIPLTLLPVTGAVFAIAAHVPGQVALGYLSIAILAAVAVEAWVLPQPPSKYVKCRLKYRMIKEYSVVTAAGMASNFLGLAMILIYGLIYGF